MAIHYTEGYAPNLEGQANGANFTGNHDLLIGILANRLRAVTGEATTVTDPKVSLKDLGQPTEVSLTTTTTLTSTAFNKPHVLSGSGYTVNLPSTSSHEGKLLPLRVAPSATGTYTLDGSGSETIDNQATIILSPNESVVLLAISGGWVVRAASGRRAIRKLDYRAAADLNAGTSVTANTWTNLGPSHSFVVGHGSSVVQIQAGGGVILGGASGVCKVGSQLLVDGTNQFHLGGDRAPTGEYANPLAGAQPIDFVGFSPGSHTVQVRVMAAAASFLFCRPATEPNFDSLYVQVTEFA